MYSKEYLSTFPFFQKVLESVELTTIHDSLTGLIARPYIIGFIHDLIQREIPFYLGIMDLDNFKGINDNYGHKVGDKVLAHVSQDLRDYIGERGLAGRFGGDEFLILFFGGNDYDEIHNFFDGMYRGRAVLRKNFRTDDLNLYLTATSGSACYPENATDYDTLFALVDKTLYRGKSKGRNCYIIFVREKHENLEIQQLAKHSLYETFYQMAELFDRESRVVEKLRLAFDVAGQNLRLFDLFYVNRRGELIDTRDGAVAARNVELDRDTVGRLYMPATLSELSRVSPPIHDVLQRRGFQSGLLVRVGSEEAPYGYLMVCPEPHNMRIWQDEDCVAAFFLARMLAEYLTTHGQTLE